MKTMRDNLTILIVLAALITGAALIATTLATTRGQAILVPYAIATTAMAFCVRNAAFSRGFFAVFATLFSASVLLHAYITLVVRTGVHISVAGHAWRMAAVAALASVASAVASLIARRAASRPSA